MKEEQFRQYISSLKSVSSYITKLKAIEKYEMDLDEAYEKDKCKSLIKKLNYSTDDQINKRKPKHNIPIEPKLLNDKYLSYKNGTGDYKRRLYKYVEFRNYLLEIDELYPESLEYKKCVEGAKKTITVNKYERNNYARLICIKKLGCYCHICGLDFEDKYGEIGKNFIHVHHKTPLSNINSEYILDPLNDLIPVCPNCHAMLHRKLDGKYLTIEEIKNLLK